MPEIKAKKCVMLGCGRPAHDNLTLCEEHIGKLSHESFIKTQEGTK